MTEAARAEVAMADGGEGERADRARRRRQSGLFALLMLAGATVGLVAALAERPSGGWGPGALPPGVAVLLALVTGAALVGGTLLFHRRIDEVERLDNLWAGSVGANTLLCGYPVWFLLWKGGVAPVPAHEWLFAAVFAATLLAYGWRKVR